jgi:hypothetical protein
MGRVDIEAVKKPLYCTYHRVDGPARIYRLEGEVNYEMSSYWIDGENYSEAEFWRKIIQIRELPLELRLTDPRWWVREMK